VQSNGSQGHRRSASLGRPRIYRRLRCHCIHLVLSESNIVHTLYDVGCTSISVAECYINQAGHKRRPQRLRCKVTYRANNQPPSTRTCLSMNKG
jgi:hypothetical protein